MFNPNAVLNTSGAGSSKAFSPNLDMGEGGI